MTNNRIGCYDKSKQEEAWLNEKRQYTTCCYYRMCFFARQVELCLDKPDACPIKLKMDEKRIESLVEEFPR